MRPGTRVAGATAVLVFVLGLAWVPRRVNAQVQASLYPRVVAGDAVERTLAADETVTFVYDGRPDVNGPDAGERYMLVEVCCTPEATLSPLSAVCVACARVLSRQHSLVLHSSSPICETRLETQLDAQLTYEAEGDQYPDPLLMVAYEAVPFIFYAENQFTTNATYYDQVAFQLVKTYHHVVVDRQDIQPGSWYITSE